jgi:acetylornithine deacetylase/succinyl-diaminopimelate desuccinylase-like protein
MPTLSEDPIANDLALDYIQQHMRKAGMYCKRETYDNHSVLLASTRPTNTLTPTVLLVAHSDVVLANEKMFKLVGKGDKLTGRGVYDMKFAIAGYMQLVSDLGESLPTYDFGILITTDEEIGSRAATQLVKNGLRPKVCIMPDSTAPGWDIETLAKGFWRFDLIARGRTAHASRPWEGESASFKLLQVLHELKSKFSEHAPDTDTLNIGKIHGGQAYNILPDEMMASVEIRYMSQKTLRVQQKVVADLCKRYDLTFNEDTLCSAVTTDINHPLVAKYMASVEQITGKRPQPITSYGGSDAPPFYDAGINCILSCCEGGGHHTDQEWISRKSFLQFVPILREFLESVKHTSSKDG